MSTRTKRKPEGEAGEAAAAPAAAGGGGGGAKDDEGDEKRMRVEYDERVVAPLPLFDPSTEVYERPKDFTPNVGAGAPVTDPYVVHAYQYCTTGRPDLCQPRAVIYPANGNETEIKTAVKYAYQNNLAVAVRSSGHQFGGFSSTNGDNIQLDLSKWNTMKWISRPDGQKPLISMGTGTRLGDLDVKLRARHAFVPHGQCSWVCVGGHVQTGGFSVDVGRSFGFFQDHVLQFTIILAPKDSLSEPATVDVKRPEAGVTSAENDELWFNVLGGSPGNFGVVLHIIVEPLWDSDYPDARTVVNMYSYSKENYKILLDWLTEISRDDDLPADFSMNIAVFQGNTMALFDTNNNLDANMSEEHPEIYGERFPFMPLPGLLLTATWANLNGLDEPYAKSEAAQKFFTGVAEVDATLRKKETWLQTLERIGAQLDWRLPQRPISPDKVTPLSLATKMLSFPQRVQANPFAGTNNCLPANVPGSFVDWVVPILDEAVNTKGLYADVGMVPYGGKHSRTNKQFRPAPTAMSHRDLGFLNLYYIHYDNVHGHKDVTEPKIKAYENVTKVADGLDAHCGGDHRWNAFPNMNNHGDSQEGDQSLDLWREQYYESKLTYLRVLKFKRECDPKDVFTPNKFAIGASRKYKLAKPGEPALASVAELAKLVEAAKASPDWPAKDTAAAAAAE